MQRSAVRISFEFCRLAMSKEVSYNNAIIPKCWEKAKAFIEAVNLSFFILRVSDRPDATSRCYTHTHTSSRLFWVCAMKKCNVFLLQDYWRVTASYVMRIKIQYVYLRWERRMLLQTLNVFSGNRTRNLAKKSPALPLSYLWLMVKTNVVRLKNYIRIFFKYL